MAVIGPRPERPFVKEIAKIMLYETRHIINRSHRMGTSELFVWCHYR
jgi:hypothetical protein